MDLPQPNSASVRSRKSARAMSTGWAWPGIAELDTDRGQEATPVMVGGVLYVSTAWSKVMAFDAATGKPLWAYDPQVPPETLSRTCCDAVNRGVAVSGGMVYVATLDGRLVALDAGSGKPRWSVLTVDPARTYTSTGAPRVVKGKVVIGNSGAEFGVRGYVSAYDARDRQAGLALLYNPQSRGPAGWRRFRQSARRTCPANLVRRRLETKRRGRHCLGWHGLRSRS